MYQFFEFDYMDANDGSTTAYEKNETSHGFTSVWSIEERFNDFSEENRTNRCPAINGFY